MRQGGALLFLAAVLGVGGCAAAQDGTSWRLAAENAAKANQNVVYCLDYAEGWLRQADPETGLLPRRLKEDWFWNAKDCAADNFPFLLLTGEMTRQHHIRRAARAIFDAERRLCRRLDSLPDDYLFDRQGFRDGVPKTEDLIFGAAEYAKDGLMPVIEWMGEGPWLDRAGEMVVDFWKHAVFETPHGTLPSPVMEVNGDLLQVMSRLYWITGDAQYREWTFRLADYYLLQEPLVDGEKVPLRDHGCEAVGGLAEAYVIAWKTDPAKHAAYREAMHSLLDTILEKGTYPDGMMPNWFNPKTGEMAKGTVSDGWGYVYDAFLTVALVDGHEPYRAAVEKALNSAHTHLGTNWEGYRGDGYADSVEGAINLLNRIPCETAWPWVEASLGIVRGLQGPDGIAEGWYGDGNSARTLMMHTLWLTQGVTAAPWRKDVRLGAAPDADGGLCLHLSTEWAWNGTLRFDIPRHRDTLRMPLDYPRINQFPEWFTVEKAGCYLVAENCGAEREVSGQDLLNYRVALKEKETLRLRVRMKDAAAPGAAPAGPWREKRFSAVSAEEGTTWQREPRGALLSLLGLDICAPQRTKPPLKPREVGKRKADGFRLTEMEFAATPERRIRVLVGMPEDGSRASCPAVVCIGGHGSKPEDVFNEESIYKGFAATLARAGAVVISPDIAYHDKDAAFKTLLGQRAWDLMRCVDYLSSLDTVGPARVGCAGLSLGGEMALWLGALDTRVAAVSSCGFLTLMDQMERNHCLCWKEEGLRELVDFPDVYALIAPRPLQCQLGEQEPRDQFPPLLGRVAFRDVQRCYTLLRVPARASLHVHPGAHEVDREALVAFLMGNLAGTR